MSHFSAMKGVQRTVGFTAALVVLGLVAGCDGPHEKAGKQADKAAGVDAGPLSKGPQQRLGALRDRAERDQARAVDAQADAAEDRARQVRVAADQQADAFERQARDIRKTAKQAAASIDNQADAIRGKQP